MVIDMKNILQGAGGSFVCFISFYFVLFCFTYFKGAGDNFE